MNKNIKISTDSISDLSPELLQEYNIPVMPLFINMDGESLPDDVTMPDKIYEFVTRTKKLPKTSTRSVDAYKEFYAQHKPSNGALIHFTISDKLSASYSLAIQAAEQMENVFVIDSKSLSTGAGLNVLYACDLAAKDELSAAEIADKCIERTKAVQASFFLDSLEFLHKGGRCSGLARFFASILKIKPMIKVVDGKMVAGKKYRGKFDALVDKYVDDTLAEFNTPCLDRVFVTYTTAPEGMVQRVKDKLAAAHPFKEILVTKAGGTITSHCGKNTIGILYFNDGNK